jgi:hypothetical protein
MYIATKIFLSRNEAELSRVRVCSVCAETNCARVLVA